MRKEKRVEVTIWLTDEEFLYIAKKAHSKDVTFNQCVEDILLEAIEVLENGIRIKNEKKQGLRRRSKCPIPGCTDPVTKKAGHRRS